MDGTLKLTATNVDANDHQSCYHMWPHSMCNNLYHLFGNLSWHMIEFYDINHNEMKLNCHGEVKMSSWIGAKQSSVLDGILASIKEVKKKVKTGSKVTWESKSKKRRKWTWYSHKKRPIFLSIRYNKEIFSVRKRQKWRQVYIIMLEAMTMIVGQKFNE